MRKLALAFLFVAGTATAQESLPAFKPTAIAGTILCRELEDLTNITDGLQESLSEGMKRLANLNRMRDEVGLPLCAGIGVPVTFTMAPHVDFIEGLNSLRGKVDSYVIPVLYRRLSDRQMTTGYILLDKPVTEARVEPTGDTL